MTRIGVRELRQNASRYLEQVKAGETVEVTQRGELVALLTPVHPSQDVRLRLIAAGRLIAAKEPFLVPRRRVAATDTASVLDELRDEG